MIFWTQGADNVMLTIVNDWPGGHNGWAGSVE